MHQAPLPVFLTTVAVPCATPTVAWPVPRDGRRPLRQTLAGLSRALYRALANLCRAMHDALNRSLGQRGQRRRGEDKRRQ